MLHQDWGVVSPRWAGIRSGMTTVRGVRVHHLVAEAASANDAPTHVLVSAMAGSATNWLDLIPPLSRLGPVIAPDLPGTLAGHTGSPTRLGPRAETNARFLRAFLQTLDIDRTILHGWSMGGLVAVLAADLLPAPVTGLVLTAPTLPWRRTSILEALGWVTLGRLAVAMGAPIARTALRLFSDPLLDMKVAALSDRDAFAGGRLDLVGGDPTRLSAELTAVWADDLQAVRDHPDRLPGAVTAFASSLSAMFIRRRPTLAALDRLDVPTTVLWGTDDPLVDAATLEGHARRPRWEAHPIDGAGHLLPVEVPATYASVVAHWLARIGCGAGR
jgi:pimeloyl-ACP methyl ester carboxylesterase